jgi:probable F420-dependent oxidoreductase
MKFALHFGNITLPEPDAAKRLAIAAEAAGFDTVIAVEHVVLPTDYSSTYPYATSGRLPGGADVIFPDPLFWLTYVAAVTTHLRLMTGVLILPQRNPVVLAKEIATMDYLSGGRVSLGIGVGWLREEFDAVGVPFERRGARANEYIAAMRTLWRDDDASFAGEFASFSGANCNPKPPGGTVPIIIGGHSEAAARRAGRIGDGFFPGTGAQVDIAPLIDLARETAAVAGRGADALEITTGCPGALPGADGDPIAAIAERTAAGVDQVALPLPAFMPDFETTLAAFGEQVISKV